MLLQLASLETKLALPDQWNLLVLDLGFNPMHGYSEVSTTMLRGAYSHANMHRIVALCMVIYLGPYNECRQQQKILGKIT